MKYMRPATPQQAVSPTLALSRAWKPERSAGCKASAAGGCSARLVCGDALGYPTVSGFLPMAP
jgi:hypothetical protein